MVLRTCEHKSIGERKICGAMASADPFSKPKFDRGPEKVYIFSKILAFKQEFAVAKITTDLG